MYQEGNSFLVSDFTDAMETDVVFPFIEEVKKQSKVVNGYIDLHINSFGGYAHLAESIIAWIEKAKQNGVVIRTIVSGVAYSAGSMVAVAGSPGHRYINLGSDHLMHYGTAIGLSESTPEQARRVNTKKDSDFKRASAHYVGYTKMDKNEVEALMRDDYAFIPAKTCIKLGLADKYMDKMSLFYP